MPSLSPEELARLNEGLRNPGPATKFGVKVEVVEKSGGGQFLIDGTDFAHAIKSYSIARTAVAGKIDEPTDEAIEVTVTFVSHDLWFRDEVWADERRAGR